MTISVQIEGQRFAGKSTLIPVLAANLFRQGLSVAIIPEWRFQDNGPPNIDDWIDRVFLERIHAYEIAKSNTADIVISDRSLVGLEAFINSSYPDKKEWIEGKIKDKFYNSDYCIFLSANKAILTERAMQRQGSIDTLNEDKIIDCYFKIYERLNIKPLVFDTSSCTIDELAKSITLIILKKVDINH